MSPTRREMCLLFPSALLPALLAKGQSEQPASLPSAMYPFGKLGVHTSNSAEIRSVLKGKLASGESLEVHETTLPPGTSPHPPHHHEHSEMWLIRKGTVEITVNGTSNRIGPGSVGLFVQTMSTALKTWARLPPLISLWRWVLALPDLK